MATRIPINKDSYNFEDRQKKIWEDMERDMERRRREWEDEIDKMRKEFFHIHPENPEFAGLQNAGALSRLPSRISARSSEPEDGKSVIEKDEMGQPVYKVCFNMKGYKADEVNVRMDSLKIMVSAKHEEKGGGSSVCREYSREVNIPRDVDPLAIQCTLNVDGYLVVHAPLPAPSYNTIKDSSVAAHSPSGVVKSTASYQTSSATSSKPQPVSGSGSAYSQQQEQQQVRTHVINQQQAPAAFVQSSVSHEESKSHPDHVTPSYKPPADVRKLDMHGFSKPPPFSSLSSAFPSGPIFPESSTQAQLSAPTITSHDGKFQLTMPINEYKPEELTVKTLDGKVVICARREVTSGNRAQTMEMNREHSLPSNVDPLTIKAFFTDTNNLIIEAPFILS